MSKFFINRPIVAMVISIITVIVGLVTLFTLPIAQFPKIIPPEIFVEAHYVGADAKTIEQSVATPIEQQLSGVDNMNYMYSLNANNGLMRLYVNFDVKTDPNVDHMLTQLRYSQAEAQLPADVRNYGVTVQKSLTSPFLFVALSSPNKTYDAKFLANYAYINLNDELTRVPGIASVTVFGAGQYAMRLCVKPDQLAKLNITVPEIIAAVNNQNTVNPAGKIGGEPAPPGQEFTYSVSAQGRLESEQEFGEIVLRANQDGSIVRLKDVARMELAAQDYDIMGRLNGKPSAILALYQLPGSNAIDAASGVKKRMAELKQRFPDDLEYTITLDTTLAVTEGISEISKTLWEALALVMLVVYIFLQGWRASHRGRHEPEGCKLQSHGRSLGAGHRDRAHSDGGVRAHGIHSRHHGAALPAICGDHRHLGAHFRLQRPQPEPRAFGAVAPPAQENSRASGQILRRIQSCLWPRHQQLCRRLRRFDSQGDHQHGFPGSGGCLRRLVWKKAALGLSTRRGSGIHIRWRAASLRRIHGTHGRRLQAGRGNPGEDAGHQTLHHCGWIQPPERRAQYLQRLFLGDSQGMGRAHEAGRTIRRDQGPSGEGAFPSAHSGRVPHFTPGHSGRWHGRWFYLYPARPVRPGPAVPQRQPQQVPRSRA